MNAVTGDKALDAMLRRLESSVAKKAMRAGITAGMTPIVTALRSAVNGADAPARVKSGARKTIGKRFAKAKGGESKGQYVAKVGFGVGKKRKAAKDRGKRKGVGISANDIHWFVLGTKERKTTAGKSTGQIPPMLVGLPAKAMATAGTKAVAAAHKKIREIIAREARKRG